MRSASDRIRGFYGAGPLHLLGLLACLTLVGYVVGVLGFDELLGTDAWWQSILVWFLGAALAHDLVLFALYALADRAYATGYGTIARRPLRAAHRSCAELHSSAHPRERRHSSGFLPGIIEQGADSYLAATGQNQHPFVGRWLLCTAATFATSAFVYAVRRARGLRPRQTDAE